MTKLSDAASIDPAQSIALNSKSDQIAAGRTPIPRVRWFHLLLLVAILGAGAVVRFVHIDKESLWLDEYWSVFLSTGRGQTVGTALDAPDGVIFDPAPPTGFVNAPPWWEIWTHMGSAIHPPLYHIVLRWWIDLFGDGDVSTRGMSAVLSLAGALVLFDALRRLHGPWFGLAAAGIMCFAVAQIDFSQQTRSYTMVALLGTIVCDAIIAIELGGASLPRLLTLGIAAAAMALTHYLAVAPLVACGAYATICLRGRERKGIFSALFAAFIFVVIVWGPWYWETHKRVLTALFYLDNDIGLKGILWGALFAPSRLVMQAYGVHFSWFAAVPIALLVFVIPLIKPGQRPGALLWWYWAASCIGLAVAEDLARKTVMLYLIRYVFLASPAIYALLATPFPIRSRIGRLAPAVLFACVVMFGIDRAHLGPPPISSWRSVAQMIDRKAGPRDLLVFTVAVEPAPQFCYMAYSHYVPNSQRPILCLGDQPPDAQTMKRLAANYHVWIFSSSLKDDVPRLFAGWGGGHYYNGPPGMQLLELFPPPASTRPAAPVVGNVASNTN